MRKICISKYTNVTSPNLVKCDDEARRPSVVMVLYVWVGELRMLRQKIKVVVPSQAIDDQDFRKNLVSFSLKINYSWGPVYYHGLTLIPAWITNYIHSMVWNEIGYLFPNFNGGTVEAWEWISNFIPHSTQHIMSHMGPYPFFWNDGKCSQPVKTGPFPMYCVKPAARRTIYVFVQSQWIMVRNRWNTIHAYARDMVFNIF